MRRFFALLLGGVLFLLAIGCGGGGSGSTRGSQLVSISTAVAGLNGAVTSINDGRALAGATVTLGSASTTADTGGLFQFTNVMPGSYTLSASTAGYLTRNYSVNVAGGATTTQDVQLSEAGVLMGNVSSAAGPVSGAKVQLSGGSLSQTATVTTDDSGNYNAGWIAVGSYRLTVTAPGFQPTSGASSTVIAGQTTTANLTLAAAPGTINGVVTSLADGHAVAGAQVSVGSATATADANGHYQLGNLLPANYMLAVSAPGFLARSYALTVTNGVPIEQDAQLSVAGVLAGTITASGGAGIAAARIQYGGGALNQNATLTADGSGHFDAGWIPVGTYALTVSAPGYRARAVTVTVPTGHTATADLTLASGAGSNAPGPENGWLVVTLPNPQVTPNWRNFAPPDCQPDPTVCVDDHRFWEEVDFNNFSAAIDASFAAIAAQGKYEGVFTIMPLADSPTYWNNIQLVYNSVAAHGLSFEPVLFPKRKWGQEWCYLYPNNAPFGCQTAPGTSTAVAYQQALKLMGFVQNLGGGCDVGSYNRPFAIWYGWPGFAPGYDALLKFWQSLPNSGCHQQSAYVIWLDEPYVGNADVAQVQAHVVNDLQRPFWINTEFYMTANLWQKNALYAPYQTVVTGFPVAVNIVAWAQGMCDRWSSAGRPERLGVWTFADRDVAPVEQYGAYLNGTMADVGSMCSY